MALLSWFGEKVGPKGESGAKLFEEICARAIERYLGGDDRKRKTGGQDSVRAHVFGFPRRLLPKGFAAAVDKLCAEIGEGSGHRKHSRVPNQKDGKLDIVAWRDFEDGRRGKLIAFGQCATGAKWREKYLELPPPAKWCGLWMRELPWVDPIRSFFVPHRIEYEAYWEEACSYGGILFDRCRIAQLTTQLDGDVADRLAGWSKYVLAMLREK